MHIHFTKTKSSTPQLLIFTLIVLLILPLNAIAKQFPDLGNDSRNILSINDEKLIGDIWMQQLRASNTVCSDPIINSYLNKLGHKLTEHIDTHNFNFTFFCIEDYTINAFAFFGGHIGIHKGLILASENENELAAAIAHEIAHISQEHILRNIVKNKQFTPITIASALVSAMLGAPDLVIPILATHQQRLINFTREHEQEADNIGIQLLADAGFDPQSMSSLFKHMSQQSQYNVNVPEYLLTHPMFATRISEAQQRANRFHYTQHSSSFNYLLIKALIESNDKRNKQEIIDNFKYRLSNQHYDNKDATLYGYALALSANNEYQHAYEILNSLLLKYPNNLIIHLGAIDTYIAQKKQMLAENKMEELLKLFPDDPSLILKYAENLIANNKSIKAKPWLLKLAKTKTPEPLTYQLLIQAEGNLGNNIGVHTAAAELNLLHGDLDNAVIQLKMALLLAKNNQSLATSIEKRKYEIEELIVKITQLSI